MAARYANRTCTVCGIRRPQPNMRQIERKVKTGNSGYSASFNPQRKKSIRINSGRNYYRTKTFWECKDYDAHNDPGYYERIALERARRLRQEAEEARIAAEKKAEEERLKKIEDELKGRLIKEANIAFSTQKQNIFDSFNNSELFKRQKQSFQKDIVKNFNCPDFDYQKYTSEIYSDIELNFDNFDHPVFIEDSFESINDKAVSRNMHMFKNAELIADVKYPNRWLYIFAAILSFLLIPPLTDPLIEDKSLVQAFWLIIPIAIFFYYKKKKKSKELEKYRTYNNLIKKLGEHLKIFLESISPYFRGVVSSHLMKSPIAKENGAIRVIDRLTYGSQAYFGDLKIFTGKDSKSDTKDNQKIKPEESETKASDESFPQEELEIKTIKKLSFEEMIIELFSLENFFDAATYILLVRIANADGKFTSDEAELIMKDLVQLSDEEVFLCKEFMKRKTHFKLIIKLILRRYSNNTELVEEIINNLFYVAEIDGNLSTEEFDEIKKIAKLLGIKNDVFQLIKEDSLKIRGDRDFIDEYNIDDILDDIDEL